MKQSLSIKNKSLKKTNKSKNIETHHIKNQPTSRYITKHNTKTKQITKNNIKPKHQTKIMKTTINNHRKIMNKSLKVKTNHSNKKTITQNNK